MLNLTSADARALVIAAYPDADMVSYNEPDTRNEIYATVNGRNDLIGMGWGSSAWIHAANNLAKV